jgi:hypothetical protein
MQSLEQKQQALAKIWKKHGRNVHVDVIIAEARDPHHALHDCFQWDDALGGQEFRRVQCRQLLTKVRYLHSTPKGEVLRVVGYIHDATAPDNKGYIDVSAVEPKSQEARTQLLAELGRIKTLIQRAYALAEIWDLDGEVSGLVDHVDGIIALLHKRPLPKKPKPVKRKAKVLA